MMCQCVTWFLTYSFVFFKQKTAYEMRISDGSSYVCSSDLSSPRRRDTPASPCSRSNPDAGPRRALFRQEIRHRQIALAGVIVEAQHPRAIGHAGKLLGDRSQRRAGRDADERALLPRRAAGIFLRVVRIDLDHPVRSEEHTSELQSLMRISYAVFCLKKKKQ